MKTMCLPGYHYNGFAATHALGHMMYEVLKFHLTSVRFEHFVCRGSLMTTYIYIYIYIHVYIYLLLFLWFHIVMLES